MYEIQCPYCLSIVEVDLHDGNGYQEDLVHQMDCPKCSKTFGYETTVTFDFSPVKTDCLNEGGEHTWNMTNTLPKCFTSFYCTQCGDTREPTEEERTRFELGSKKEYFNEILGGKKDESI